MTTFYRISIFQFLDYKNSAKYLQISKKFIK